MFFFLHLFSIQNYLEYLAQFFLHYHPCYFGMGDAMRNPRRLSTLSYVLKPKAIEGAFQNRFDLNIIYCVITQEDWKQVHTTFYISVDEPSLNKKVFMIIKI